MGGFTDFFKIIIELNNKLITTEWEEQRKPLEKKKLEISS